MCFTPSTTTNGENFRLDDQFSEFFNDKNTGRDENHDHPIVLSERVGSQQGTDLDTDDEWSSQLHEEEQQSRGNDKA